MMTKESLSKAFDTEFKLSKDNYVACCPFHNERTPSFYVHKDEYIAHCFGCDIAGPIDRLLANHDGISTDAARLLLGIDATEEIRKKLGRHKQELPRLVTFPESWLAPWKKAAHKYVLDRGFTQHTLKAARSCYDPVRQRQVFPQYDQGERLRGAVGRDCTPDQRQSKWYFYWEYDKGSLLYRPFRVEPLRPVLVVEGVFDLLWCYQNGATEYVNIVAPIGAQLTRSQVAELKRCSREVIIGLDNDAAGEVGTSKLHKALRASHAVRIIRWPENAKDWMDLSEDEISKVVNEAETPLQKSLQTYKNKR